MGSDGSGDETCSSITLDWIGLDGDGDSFTLEYNVWVEC